MHTPLTETHNIYTKTPIKEMERNWKTIKQYEEILFEEYEGIAKITINRPRYRNAFTPQTVSEIGDALRHCREAADIAVVVLTGAGNVAFCSGGDMHVKGRGGYVGGDGVPPSFTTSTKS